MYKKINTPFNDEIINSLQAGDKVLLSGTIYTARDAAHKRIVETMNRGEEIPFELQGQCIYYVGPCPAKEGQIIGSAGPTTSYRMDDYTPLLLDNGLKGMIGKGIRNQSVIESMAKNHAIYFVAVGGAAAVIANTITASKVIAYDDLGAEAVREIVVEDMPLIVAIDSKKNNLYASEPEKYKDLFKPAK